MIHQFIFAHPRPGMTEGEFQDYWLRVHAVQYASKITQIRKYLLDTRIALPGETGDPLWGGVAEIWLKNSEEQLASLESKEFLEGARADEPKWAAFWRTVALDTTAYELIPGDHQVHDLPKIKRLVLLKRRAGLPLEMFRAYCKTAHVEMAKALPGLSRYQQGHVVDAAYAIGEPLLDCVEQFWFETEESALAAGASSPQGRLDEDYRLMADERFVHTLLVREHWIIGPEERPYPPGDLAPA